MGNVRLKWKGLERNTTEDCAIKLDPEFTNDLFSRIRIGEKVFGCMIYTDKKWNTESFCFRFSRDEQELMRYFSKRGEAWFHEGRPIYGLDGCTDIDFSVTPLTNTLPINRLKLEIGESAEVRVVYVDPELDQMYASTQRYTRLSDFQYRFETAANDFEAVITVDENGFVLDYPGLFERI